jgi:hypothetical protein
MTSKESKPTRKWAVVASLMLLATAAMDTPAEAAKNFQGCVNSRGACEGGCNRWSDGQFKRSCKARCKVSFDQCIRELERGGGGLRIPGRPGGGVAKP